MITEMMNWAKFYWAILLAAIFGLQKLLVDDHMSTLDWVSFIGILAAAAATGLVTNTPWLATAKLWATALVAGTDVLVGQLGDGWQTNLDLWPTLIAVAQIVGVGLIPNVGYEPLAGTRYYRPREVAA